MQPAPSPRPRIPLNCGLGCLFVLAAGPNILVWAVLRLGNVAMGSVAVPHLWDWLLGAFLTAGVIVLVGWDRAESLGWRGVLLLLGACMVLAPLLVPMPTIYLGPKHSGLWLTGLATPAGVGGQVLIEDMGCSGTCLIPCLGEVVGVAGDPVPLHEESDLPATVPVGMILVDREVGHVTAVENETFVRLESRTAPSLWRPWWLAR